MSKEKKVTIETEEETVEYDVSTINDLDEDIEETEEVEETTEELDWKAAARKLKKLVEDQSIDTYFKRAEVAELRERYNSKERSVELYNLIMEV